MSDLAELLRKAMEHRLADVRTAMPVRVKAYDVTAQTVDVEPLVREITETEGDGDDIIEALAVIRSVPVAFPRAAGFFVTFPIVPGDTGQIIICDRSIDQWRTMGSESYTPEYGYAVNPLDRRQHHQSAAVFYPGLSDSLSPLLDAHATDMVIGQDSGSSIHIKPGGEIHIGSAPTDFVALAAKVLTELGKIETAFNTHTHGPGTFSVAAAPGPVTGISGTGPTYTKASVAATKVKAD
jgi:hypothetical protein